MAKILLVDDDLDFRETIQDFLEAEHHEVETVGDGEEALSRLKIYPYELIVLDWNMPGKDGIVVLTEFRAAGGKTPVLMLTAKGYINDRTTGLDSGADDYLTKPFDMRELSSRVRALLRRPVVLNSDVLKAGNVTVNMRTFRAFIDDVEIKLLPKELSLLAFLIKHRGQVFSVEDLLNRVWSSESDSSTDAVRQCITRLRRKLDSEGQPSVIVTVTGLGYKVELPG
ncbi:response regulator transcription factor [bacterium]|nr:response regulator transcription factor [bacterium]MBP9811118.1 response regulator transcription factor [bacterium]